MNRKQKKWASSELFTGAGPYMILTILLLSADQLTKLCASKFLQPRGEVPLIPPFIVLTYVRNIGAAFGIFSNKQWIFVLFALVILGFVVWIFPRLMSHSRYVPLRILGSLLIAGAAGNMIDRILHNYVIDFIYLKFIRFPVFNLADIYVVGSCICFLLLMFFYYSDDEVESLLRSRKKEAYIQELIETVKKEREHSDD